jgi:hypothetical protein
MLVPVHGAKPHLIGAYGMFWDRHEVNWRPGSGPAAWQLLGRINRQRGALRVCDFRRAQGFYVLFDEFRATHVGLARGRYGIGQRLRAHHMDDGRNWQRFCWFAFDDVVDDDRNGWSVVLRRDEIDGAAADLVLRESEALLIAVLGSKDQSETRFRAAQRWEQLREADLLPSGIAGRVDPGGFTDRWWRQQAEDATN